MNIANLKAELDTDPLTRGYAGMTDEQVADSLNTVDRNAPAPLDAIRTYTLLELRNDMTLFGRIEIVSQSADGSDPLGEAILLTNNHITTAKSMMAILQPASSFSLDTTDSRFGKLLSDLAAGSGCKAIAAADKTAIEAMSADLQSRGQEIQLGVVKAGQVTRARAA